MFSYKGVDSNFDYKVGTIKAANTTEAIKLIKETEDVLIIVSLNKASNNKTVSRFSTKIQEQFVKFENRMKSRKKSKRSRKRKADNKDKSLAEKSPILKAIKNMTGRTQEPEVMADEEFQMYTELSSMSFDDSSENKVRHLSNAPQDENKGREINWDLLEVDEVDEDIKNNNKIKVKEKEILMFTRKFHIMLSSGVPLLSSLTLLRDMEGKNMSIVINGLLEEIKTGNSLSEAMANYPKIFNVSYISLISIGETSGNLDECLEDIIRMKEQEEKVFKKVKTASIYPSIIGAVLSVMMIAMSIFFLPKFEEMYEDQDLMTPVFTQIVFGIAAILPYILVALVIAIGALMILRKRVPRVNQAYFGMRDKLLLNIPIVKDITNALYMYSLSYTVSLMLKNGIRLSDTLSLAGRSINNIYIKNEIENIGQLMSHGLSFSEALREQPHIDDILTNITLTGEESGQMVDSLAKVSEYYNDELNSKVDAMMEIVPPATIVIISVIAAPVIVAAYLPILEISSGGGM